MPLSGNPEKRAKQLKNLIPFDGKNMPNPCGRPKGIVSYIKEKTNNLKKAIDLHVRILEGKTFKGTNPFGNSINVIPTIAMRADSASWLYEKAVGNRPPADDGTNYDLRTILLMELTKKPHETEYIEADTFQQSVETE